jgi:hypothetical protein
MTKESFELIFAIVDRVERELSLWTNRLSLSMDIEYSGVNLQALLDADRETFLHDVSGIVANMDRKNKRLGGCFVPRVGFAD